MLKASESLSCGSVTSITSLSLFHLPLGGFFIYLQMNIANKKRHYSMSFNVNTHFQRSFKLYSHSSDQIAENWLHCSWY